MSRLLEIADGVFVVMLAFSALVTINYSLRATATDWRARHWRPETKAAWAMGALFVGLLLRVCPHWLSRHLANQHIAFPAFDGVAPEIILASTVLTAWACVCWVRTVIPIRWCRGSWLAALLIAVVVGVYLAA